MKNSNRIRYKTFSRENMHRFQAIIGIFFLLLFCLFTFIVHTHKLDSFDFNTTVRLQNHIPRKFDTFFSILSIVGSAEVMTVILVLTVISLRWRVIPVFILYGIGSLAEVFGKILIRHPGPPYLFFRYNLNFVFPSSFVLTQHSYPSGHAFRTVFVVTIVMAILFAKNKSHYSRVFALIVAVLYCGTMLLSRVTLGEHWTTDVIGGTLIALGLGFLGMIFHTVKIHQFSSHRTVTPRKLVRST